MKNNNDENFGTKNQMYLDYNINMDLKYDGKPLKHLIKKM